MVTSIVAGGAGFLGSHLVDALVKRRESVIVLDDLSSGRLGNLESAISSGRTTFIYIDAAANAAPLRNVIFSAGVRKVDYIYVIPPPNRVYFDDREGDRLAAFDREFAALIELAIEQRARLIYVIDRQNFSDQPNLGAPQHSRIRDADRSEAAVTSAVRERSLDARIVQFASCYGPRNSPCEDSLVATLFDAALQRRPMPIEGSGEQIRSMTFVKDAIEGLLLVAVRSQVSLKPVDIADTDERTVIDIARTSAHVAGVEFHVQHIPGPTHDRPPLRPDLREAVRIGWAPATSLEDGLRSTYAWFSKEHRQFI